MVFSSTIFLFLFLPLTIVLYYALPAKLKNFLLLAASLVFYAWGEPLAVFLMLFSIAGNYLMGRLIAWSMAAGRAAIVRGTLVAAVALNIGMLVVYKYSDFLVFNLNSLLDLNLPLPNIPLPIGISFFTFQALSYVIDVYREEGTVQKNVFSLALYISLFPQLIAGPIVRYRDVDAQIRARKTDYRQMLRGVALFIVGLAKKVMVANVAGEVADQIFGVPVANWTGGMAWLAVASYTLQIYFDFSGYSDMAIGLGRIFGFEFLENFRHPYVSQSIREFWRRWHISLSTWFRDYVYVPLGGSRNGSARLYLNQLIVFLLCGLWHGASWTFVVWGLWHGMFLVLERMGIGAALERAWRPVRHLYVMAVVMAGWVFFRAATLPEAWRILRTLVGAGAESGSGYSAHLYLTPLWLLTAAAGCVACTPIPAALAQRALRAAPSARIRFSLRLAATAGLLALLTYSAISVACSAYNPFIYFRF
jgi:alginate O-acetyltransferase complex protein AlgI